MRSSRLGPSVGPERGFVGPARAGEHRRAAPGAQRVGPGGQRGPGLGGCTAAEARPEASCRPGPSRLRLRCCAWAPSSRSPSGTSCGAREGPWRRAARYVRMVGMSGGGGTGRGRAAVRRAWQRWADGGGWRRGRGGVRDACGLWEADAGGRWVQRCATARGSDERSCVVAASPAAVRLPWLGLLVKSWLVTARSVGAACGGFVRSCVLCGAAASQPLSACLMHTLLRLLEGGRALVCPPALYVGHVVTSA
jgi:hypothetical protein